MSSFIEICPLQREITTCQTGVNGQTTDNLNVYNIDQ